MQLVGQFSPEDSIFMFVDETKFNFDRSKNQTTAVMNFLIQRMFNKGVALDSDVEKEDVKITF